MGPKQVAVVGVICVLAGWLLASMVTPPVARVQSLPDARTRQPEPARHEGAGFVEPLQWKRPHAVPAPVLRRNPFTFASRESEPRRDVTPVLPSPAPASPLLAVAAPAPGPQLTLAGIGLHGSERSAVLSVEASDVRIVRVGDTVAGMTVEEITEDAVILTAGTARRVLRLPR